MYKIGDILKTNLAEAEIQYEGCKGTVVYNTLMKRATAWRFEVIDVLAAEYTLRRVHDQQEDTKLKSETHQLLTLADD